MSIDRLVHALRVDQVLSERQSLALCGGPLSSLELERAGVVRVPIVLETVSGSVSSHRTVMIYSLRSRRRLLSTPEWRLGHLAGAAEVRFLLAGFDPEVELTLELAGVPWTHQERRLLGTDPSSWLSEADAVGQSERPDAVWRSSAGLVAVEYDTGSYRPEVIARKFRAFSPPSYPGGIIWAVSSHRRQVTLRRRFPRNVPVLLAQWW